MVSYNHSKSYDFKKVLGLSYRKNLLRQVFSHYIKGDIKNLIKGLTYYVGPFLLFKTDGR